MTLRIADGKVVEFPFTRLSRVDQAIARKFANGESDRDGFAVPGGEPKRTWISANGDKSFLAGYVCSSVENQTVTLRINGEARTFPAKPFSPEDKLWLGQMSKFEQVEALSSAVEFDVAKILSDGVVATNFVIVTFRDSGERKEGKPFSGFHFVRFETAGKDLAVGRGFRTRLLPRDPVRIETPNGFPETVSAWELLTDWKREIFSEGGATKETESAKDALSKAPLPEGFEPIKPMVEKRRGAELEDGKTPPQRASSDLAGRIKMGMNRVEVISILGPAKWVHLPGDQDDHGPLLLPGQTLELVWENPEHTPIRVLFEGAYKVTGWDEGRLKIPEAARKDAYPGAEFLATKGRRKELATIRP